MYRIFGEVGLFVGSSSPCPHYGVIMYMYGCVVSCYLAVRVEVIARSEELRDDKCKGSNELEDRSDLHKVAVSQWWRLSNERAVKDPCGRWRIEKTMKGSARRVTHEQTRASSCRYGAPLR